MPSNLNQTLVAEELNLAFKRNLVVGSITNANYAGEFEGIGDTVTIVRPKATTIRSYSNDTDITVDSLSSTAGTLTISEADYWAFYAHDDETISQYVDAFIAEDAYQLMSAVDTHILEHYSDAVSANKVSVDVSAGDADAAAALVSAIRQARAKLTKQNVPDVGRYLVIGPDEPNLVEEKLVARETAMGDDVTRRGFVGQLAGFSVYISNNLDGSDVAGDEYRHCLFGHTSSRRRKVRPPAALPRSTSPISARSAPGFPIRRSAALCQNSSDRSVAKTIGPASRCAALPPSSSTRLTARSLSTSLSTHHHLNPDIIEKYRQVDWIFAVYKNIELMAIFILTPSDLDPYFRKWEEMWHARNKRDINNPKIPLSFVRKHGKLLYQRRPRMDSGER